MARIKSECPRCHKKNVIEKAHKQIDSYRFITLDCGHTYSEKLSITKSESITLKDGKVLYPYQVEGFHFAERSSFNCLIADQPGLGKTIQAVALIKEHYSELKPVLIVAKGSLLYQWQMHVMLGCERFAQIIKRQSEILPNLGIYLISFDMANKLADKINDIIKPRTLILDEVQMIKNHEAKRTNGVRKIASNTIEVKRIEVSEKEKSKTVKRAEIQARDLMKYHGISDRFTLAINPKMNVKLGLCECRVKGEGIIEGRISLSKKHLEENTEEEILDTILHEIAHAITPGAGHVKLWKQTSVSIGGNGDIYAWCEGTIKPIEVEKEKVVKNKIFLSATPIKNNSVEYFPALNLLRPEIFPDKKRYIDTYVDWYLSGRTWKPGGLKDPEGFQELVKDFIIRRTTKEVLPDLPSIRRDYQYYEMGVEVQKAYDKGVDKLEDFLDNTNQKSTNFKLELQGHLMILYHIVGLSKIEPVLEYVQEFLGGTENGEQKLTIFHHHIDVGSLYEKKFAELGIPSVRLISTYSNEKRESILSRFRRDPEVKIFIAPTLTCGEGIDLEFCSTAILGEREWNPANEEQVEGRFIRATPEVIAKAKLGLVKVNMIYPVAVGTVDNFFAEKLERKRQYVSETLDGKAATTWDQSEIMLELAERAIKREKR